jgi:xanthine dehydrogenase YagR molybdenum-binding subunit
MSATTSVLNMAYGYILGAAIAKGRIASIDTARAKAAPGVLAVVTAQTAGKLAKGNFNTAKLLAGPEVEHYHQAVAIVVATSFEQARAAAALIKVDYVRAQGVFDLASAKSSAINPGEGKRRYRGGRFRRRRSPMRPSSWTRPTPRLTRPMP